MLSLWPLFYHGGIFMLGKDQTIWKVSHFCANLVKFIQNINIFPTPDTKTFQNRFNFGPIWQRCVERKALAAKLTKLWELIGFRGFMGFRGFRGMREMRMMRWLRNRLSVDWLSRINRIYSGLCTGIRPADSELTNQTYIAHLTQRQP